MKTFRKYLLLSVAMVAMSQLFWAGVAGAQFTILPYTNLDASQCTEILAVYDAGDINDCVSDMEGTSCLSQVLGCGIKTGRITLRMVPFFVTYFANFLLSVSGIICVLFIVVGGYWYIYGGMTEQKDKGKKYIGNALKGMVISILAWVIVSVIINAVTS